MTTKKNEQFLIWDPIENIVENCDSEEDFENYIKENYIDCGELHPDVELVELLVRRKYVVYDEEKQKLMFNNF